MRELKPCPFCGGEAEFHIYGRSCNVVCSRCQIGTRLEHIDEYEVAIDAWNTRAERTCRMEWDEDGEGDELYPVGHVTCSACDAWLYAVNTMRFCPECGARVVSE